jgi:DNA-binding Lrp family transcriptional regulator
MTISPGALFHPDGQALYRGTVPAEVKIRHPKRFFAIIDPQFGQFLRSDDVVRFKLASMAQYESLADQYFTADPAVKRVDSLVVMKAVKGRHELSLPRSDHP